MTYNPNRHHRRSIRLQGYDYSQVGAYFVTICTYGRECLFGEVIDGEMLLNEYGRAVEQEWLKTPKIRPNVRLDKFIVMPNHLHGVIIIEHRVSNTINPYCDTPLLRSPSQTLGAIVRGFKGAITKYIHQSLNLPGTPIWQRNYYERILRSEDDLKQVREYIISNPAKWDLDEENPANYKSIS